MSAINSSKDKYVAVHVESSGYDWTENKACGVALSWQNQSVFLHNEDYGIEGICFLLQCLYQSDKIVVFYNAELFMSITREVYGIEQIPNNFIDLTRVSYIIYDSVKSLSDWGIENYGVIANSGENVLTEYINHYQLDKTQVPRSILDLYVCSIAVLTRCLLEDFLPKAEKENATWLRYEHDLIPMMVDLSNQGMPIDMYRMEELISELESEANILHSDISSVVNGDFDVHSNSLVDYFHQQIGDDYLYGEAQGKINKEALQIVSQEYPQVSHLANQILQYRENEKQRTSYLYPMRDKQVNGVIHATFDALGTATGRISCHSPSLHNIPRDSVVRSIFVPKNKFYEYDFSQLDYRLSAVRSQEFSIMQAYLNDVDFHSLTGNDINATREVGKTLNYLTTYGGGPVLFAKKSGISVSRAKEYIHRYWKNYPALNDFMFSAKRFAEEHGYIHTMLGRKINITHDFYKAPIYIIQGTAADVMKMSLLRVGELLNNTDIQIKNVIYDSVLFDNMDSSYVHSIKKTMESFEFQAKELSMTMPIKVDIKVYPKHWGEGYLIDG